MAYVIALSFQEFNDIYGCSPQDSFNSWCVNLQTVVDSAQISFTTEVPFLFQEESTRWSKNFIYIHGTNNRTDLILLDWLKTIGVFAIGQFSDKISIVHPDLKEEGSWLYSDIDAIDETDQTYNTFFAICRLSALLCFGADKDAKTLFTKSFSHVFYFESMNYLLSENNQHEYINNNIVFIQTLVRDLEFRNWEEQIELLARVYILESFIVMGLREDNPNQELIFSVLEDLKIIFPEILYSFAKIEQRVGGLGELEGICTMFLAQIYSDILMLGTR